MNEDIEEFSPLNFVIPRASELKAEYQEDLLNGVVEITGDVMYDDGSANGKLAKLQAVPYYAWNNRGDNGVQGQNRSSQMLIWTEATDEEISDLMITGGMPITPGESTTLTAELTSGEAQSYQWEIVSGDSLWIVKDEDAATVTIKGLAVGKTTLKVTVTTADGKTLTDETEFEVEEKKDPRENNVAPKATPSATFVNPYLDRNTAPQKVIDGELADGPSMTWNTYAMSGDTATITLTWDKEYDLYGMRVMWWSDNGGVKFPQSCKAEYYDAETDSWVELTDMTDETGAAITSVGVKYGTETETSNNESSFINGNNRYWNVATFTEPIKTTKIRLTPTRNGSGSTGFGIGEWEVFGEVSGSVDEAELESITVTPPTKTEYTVGEELVLDGMKVTANYSDDTTKDVAVADCKVSGYDKTKVGDQTVTVTYEGKTATFKVTVKEAAKPDDTDKKELETAVKNAIPDTEKAKYTEESWAAYEEALKKAEEVLAKEDATQQEIDDAVAALDKAAKALQAKGLPYEDVVESDWFYDEVAYNYYEEIMTGMDPTHFGPYVILPRAQFATILHRIEGKPAAEYTNRFPDVPDEQFYSTAVLWAADAKIITGYTDSGYFGTNDPITREQMVTMMYRYAEYKGYESKDPTDISAFTDADKVTEFAEKAMKWAVANGIIAGKENEDGSYRLDPQGDTSRAECAIIIERFMKTFEE